MRRAVFPLILAGLALGLLPGCNRLPEGEPMAETSEPAYEEGKRMMRQGRVQEALASFFEVIESRRDGAPESHLEVGLIYQLEVKDPIAAIYHYRRFLELKPNAQQADLVEQRVAAAKRDFARTLPAQPLENQAIRNDLLDVVEDLQRENARLKNEISSLRTQSPAGRGAVANLQVGRPPDAAARNPLVVSPISPAPLSEQEERELTPPTRPATPAATPAAAQRTHTVVRGDTLSSLSRRYYNTTGRFREIYHANRDKMRSENDLQVGMVLVIPE